MKRPVAEWNTIRTIADQVIERRHTLAGSHGGRGARRANEDSLDIDRKRNDLPLFFKRARYDSRKREKHDPGEQQRALAGEEPQSWEREEQTTFILFLKECAMEVFLSSSLSSFSTYIFIIKIGIKCERIRHRRDLEKRTEPMDQLVMAHRRESLLGVYSDMAKDQD